jgi:hypothetical protein
VTTCQIGGTRHALPKAIDIGRQQFHIVGLFLVLPSILERHAHSMRERQGERDDACSIRVSLFLTLAAQVVPVHGLRIMLFFLPSNIAMYTWTIIPLAGCIRLMRRWGSSHPVRYPFALRAERNGTNASDVRYPDATDPLYLLYLWTLGRRFLHSHLSPAYPVIPSWTHVMTFLQPRFVVIGTWHVYKPSYISPQSLVK